MGQFRGVELADLTLTGDRVELRRWRPEDPGAARFSRADAEHFASAAGHPGRDSGSGLASALVERSSGRVVGLAALELGPNPSIAYWVAPDARGHGYAAEAARLLAEWAFGLGVPRVELLCDVRNLASIRTALSAGFAFEGVARRACLGSDGPDGQPADLARFARLADDPGDPVPPGFPPLPGGRLSDGVLALRPMEPSDADDFAETEDEESVRWSFDGQGRRRDDITRAATHAGLTWLVGREARFAMEDIATGAFAGELQVRRSGPPQIAALGYVVHPRFRGRGYTTRALRLVTPWAFDLAGLARLELGAKRGNLASQRAARSAGFELEGVRAGRLRDPDGSFSDEVCFALIDPAVRAAAAPEPDQASLINP